MRLYDFYPLEHRLVRHRYSARTGNELPRDQRDGGHRGPGFGAWHREWLRRFEMDLQSVDPSVTLPYWDLTDHQGTRDVIFQDGFMGPSGSPTDNKLASGFFRESVPKKERPSWWPNQDDGTPLQGFMVMPGLTTIETETMADHATKDNLSFFNTTTLTRNLLSFSLLPTRDDIRELMKIDTFYQRPNIDTFSQRLEGRDYHEPGHTVVGGLMASPRSSPNDPVFFLHHCGVDMIWALWQRRHDQKDLQYLPPKRGRNGESVTAIGHHLEDPMWPWDGTLATNPNKAIPPPQQPFPPADPDMKPPTFPDDAFVRQVHSQDIVKVGDVIDHHNLPNGTSYMYDVEIPFELNVSGKKLAWIEPYFGDLSLTGNIIENAGGEPGSGDLIWGLGGVSRGWLESDTGNLHLRGRLIKNETDYSNSALNDAIVLKHYNQPLGYFDRNGNFHLKGRLLNGQIAVS